MYKPDISIMYCIPVVFIQKRTEGRDEIRYWVPQNLRTSDKLMEN
jgi:hypothetical protein